MNPPSPEPELIARARAGDEEAFGQLVTLHADQVYGALRRFGLSSGDAEDVAQDVFLRAWRGLGRFEGRSSLSTWLYRIAFNEAQRRLGRHEPATAAGGADTGSDPQGPAARVADTPLHGPAAQALQQECEATLQDALARLPPDWRAAVVLRDLEGLSTADAAAVVGAREAAFKSRLHRGRMQLRGLLEPYLELEQT